MRVLVEVSDRLGGLVADVAVLQSLANGLENCTLEVVISDILAGIIEDCTFIHRRHLYAPHRFMGTVSANLAVLAQEWDVFLQQCPNGALRWAQPWMRATVHRQRAARGYEDEAAANMWENHLAVLDGVVPDYMGSLVTRIPLLDGRVKHAHSIANVREEDRILTVSPGAGIGYQPWAEGHAVAVVEGLRDSFDHVLVLGRAANGLLCKRVAARTGGTTVAGSMPFPYALGLISRSSFHIGTDNDMAQLAASFGVTTLCVGGPRNGWLKPWRQHQLTGDPASISVAETLATARGLLR